MDAGPLHHEKRPWRPDGCDCIGLLLQGGGALGAYQAGVYEALHEAGLEPTWLAGVSIGSVNAALIAGNPREKRVEALRAFWNTVTLRPVWGFLPDGDGLRKAHNLWSSFLTMAQGQPGLFTPNFPSPWLRPRGAVGATAFYDSAPMHETLLKLVDFERINNGEIRFAVGAVNVATGNFAYFDNADHHDRAGAHHGQRRPATGAADDADRPASSTGTAASSPTRPLQHLLDHIDGENALVFQVDLFSARGPIPRDMAETLGRAKGHPVLVSRTRLTTDYYRQAHAQRIQIKRLLDKVPEDRLSDEERALKARLATMLPAINILQLIYQQAAHEGEAKDYDFSKSSMRDHWAAGLARTRAPRCRGGTGWRCHRRRAAS